MKASTPAMAAGLTNVLKTGMAKLPILKEDSENIFTTRSSRSLFREVSRAVIKKSPFTATPMTAAAKISVVKVTPLRFFTTTQGRVTYIISLEMVRASSFSKIPQRRSRQPAHMVIRRIQVW